MPRVALTDSQRLEKRMDELCSRVIKVIQVGCMVNDGLNKRETAEAIGIKPNTWLHWRKKKLSGSFRDVAKALDVAGYRITIEPKKEGVGQL